MLTIDQAKLLTVLRFTGSDMEGASDEWGANCGPAAIAAICGLTLDELRPHLGDFEAKHYTNPTLMLQTLKRLGISHQVSRENRFPAYGLARIQWEGPWTNPGVPIRARYRHTHWIGAMQVADTGVIIFDVNALNAGGWVREREWSTLLVPWLLEACEPNASGRWHVTHAVEVTRP